MLKNLIYIVSFTAFVTLVWIFLGIYHNVVSTTISTTTASQINPIVPNFDTKTITQLENRTNISSDLSEIIVYPTSSPSFPTIGATSSKSATLVPSPTLGASPTPTTPTNPVLTPTPPPAGGSTGPTPTPAL